MGFATSKKAKAGVVVITFVSAWSCSAVHINLFLVLKSGLNGVISLDIVFVPDSNWLANSTNEHSSICVVSLGNCVMAAVIKRSS